MGLEFGQARNHTAWRPEPEGRGTYGLLSTCLLTMILCVWTAVHLNLPEHREHSVKYLPSFQTLRKLRWLLIGLFAPEVVSWSAFEQYREATTLYNDMKEALGEETPCSKFQTFKNSLLSRTEFLSKRRDVEKGPDFEFPTTPKRKPRRNEWTMTHSYYVIMGGFAFDTSVLRDGRNFFPNGYKRLTVTSRGVLALAKTAQHLLPDIPVSRIKDKSKANRLAKTIVIFQATWFVAQCITRMAYGMTISLVELNTFAHAICALIAYWLWWQKPLDIEEPTIIVGEDAELFAVGLCMRTKRGARFMYSNYITRPCKKKTHLYYDSKFDTDAAEPSGQDDNNESRERGTVATGKDTPTTSWFNQHPGIPENPPYTPVDPPDWFTSDTKTNLTDPPPFKLYMGQSLFGFCARYPLRQKKLIHSVGKHGFLHLHRPFLVLQPADILRLQLAREFCKTYPSFYETRPDLWGPTEVWQDYLLVHRISDLPTFSDGAIEDPSLLSILVSLLFAGLAYGGLHLLAWSPPVRTPIETLLWRISGIATIAYGAMPLFGVAGYYASRGLVRVYVKVLPEWFRRGLVRVYDDRIAWMGQPRSVNSDWLDKKRNVGYAMLYTMVGVLRVVAMAVGMMFIVGSTLFYVFSRVYLVVECFISAGRLPESVFETPQWARYMPHVS